MSYDFGKGRLFVDNKEIGEILDVRVNLLDEWLAANARERALRAEKRVIAFMKRTKLKLEDIELAYFQATVDRST